MTEGGGGGEFLPPEPRGPAFGPGPSSSPSPSPAPSRPVAGSPATPESSIPAYEAMEWGAPLPRADDPGNSGANVSFALALGGGGLLLITTGGSSILSLGLGVAAAILGQQARRRFERGETAQHPNIAMAGLVLGIVTSVLAFAATVLIVAALIRE